MIRNISMLILCVIVGGAMFVTLKLFLRKLVKIEEQMWGEKARQAVRAKKKSDAA